jgi:3-hydroxypropionyl-coenzyme A dehydratase
MSYSCINIEKKGEILKLILNRPEKLNALNSIMLAEIKSILEEYEYSEDFRVIIISGAGRAFCAGADINEWNEILTKHATQEKYIVPRYTTICNEVFNMIYYYEKPIIAQIHGYCLGGGLELALACDIRIAAENAVLGFPEIKLGAFPGTGGTQRLPRLISLGKALELILSGVFIDGKEAEKIGLVNHAVPFDALDEKVTEIAKQISLNSPLAVSLAKKAIKYGGDLNLKNGITLESLFTSIVCKSKTMIEGYKAFIEKKRRDNKENLK